MIHPSFVWIGKKRILSDLDWLVLIGWHSLVENIYFHDQWFRSLERFFVVFLTSERDQIQKMILHPCLCESEERECINDSSILIGLGIKISAGCPCFELADALLLLNRLIFFHDQKLYT
jgi:hypothetical protein